MSSGDRRESPLTKESIEVDQCSLEVKQRILRLLPFFAELREAEVAFCSEHFHDYGFGAGEAVYRTGQAARRLWVVASGKVKLVRTASRGQNLLVAMLGDGDYFGSLSPLGDELYGEDAIAHVQSCVLGIDAERFSTILSRFPSVSIRLVGIVAQRLRLAHGQLEMLGALGVEGRIAVTLLELAGRFGEKRRFGTLIQLPLSREDLAEMAGTTTESASRVLSRLAREGLIRTGRRWVAVADRERLAALRDTPAT